MQRLLGRNGLLEKVKSGFRYRFRERYHKYTDYNK
jgi:hypothetical protein